MFANSLDRIKSWSAPGRMLAFLLTLLLIWLPGLGIIYGTIASTRDINDPYVANDLTILTMGLLTIEFLIFLPWWGKQVYGIDRIFERYGLSLTKANRLFLLKGLAIGIGSNCSLFAVQFALGLVEYHAPETPLWQLIIQGGLSALGIGFAEELFFRGWMLTELERDYSPKISLLLDSLIFSALHFIKPIAAIISGFPQFPGLWLFGIVMIAAKRSHQNLLGIAIGLHSGMVWAFYVINVGKIFVPTGKVSDWITGIGGNPVAGLLGIIGLGLVLQTVSRKPRSIVEN
jgi:uncharacterized protein